MTPFLIIDSSLLVIYRFTHHTVCVSFMLGIKGWFKISQHIYIQNVHINIYKQLNRIWMYGISVNNILLTPFQFQVYNSMIFRQKYQQDLKTCISAYTNHLWYDIALL